MGGNGMIMATTPTISAEDAKRFVDAWERTPPHEGFVPYQPTPPKLKLYSGDDSVVVHLKRVSERNEVDWFELNRSFALGDE